MSENPIIHRISDVMSRGRQSSVCIFADGVSILDVSGGGNTAMTHMNADDLRALAKLLNEAVEHLPANAEVSL